jgi:outer membrane protein assembly factor BamB
VGNPISVSPAVIKINPVIVIFGTGGTDWASTANDKRYYIYAINASDTAETPTYAGGAGTEWWTAIQLASGEKVWSSPTIAAGQIFIATAIGSMESTDARQDLAAEGESAGTLRSISLNEGTTTWSRDDIGKTRGSIYVDRQHIYLTTIDNEITQVGGEGFQLGSTNVDVMDWMELF